MPNPNATHSIIVHALYGALPPPLLTTPESLQTRMDSAIALVASLVPANDAEALLAANWVGATMQALDTQAQAHQPGLSWDRQIQCLSQVNAMQRTAKGLLEQLRVMQTLRMKRKGTAPDPDQAAWTEHRVSHTMTAALGRFQDAVLAARPDNPDQATGQNPDNRNHETDSSRINQAHQAWLGLAYGPPDQPPPSDPAPANHPTARTGCLDAPEAQDEPIAPTQDAPRVTGEPDRHVGSDQPMRHDTGITIHETDSRDPPPTGDKPPLTSGPTPRPNPRWVQADTKEDHKTDHDRHETGHAARRVEYADAVG